MRIVFDATKVYREGQPYTLLTTATVVPQADGTVTLSCDVPFPDPPPSTPPTPGGPVASLQPSPALDNLIWQGRQAGTAGAYEKAIMSNPNGPGILTFCPNGTGIVSNLPRLGYEFPYDLIP